MLYPLNIWTLMFSILIFHVFGVAFGILLFPKIYFPRNNERNYLEKYFVLIGLGFTGNAFFGYFLDIIWNITWYSYLILVITVVIITISYRYNYFKISWKKFLLKKKFKKRSFNINYIWVFCFLLILSLILINFYNYSLSNVSLPLNDPIYTFQKIRLSIENQHITWDENSNMIGLLNWTERFYPVGFYINLTFLSIFDPNNLFFIIKFFGPTVSVLTSIQIYFLCKKITNNKIASLFGLIFWVGVGVNTFYSIVSLASVLALYNSILSLYFVFHDDKSNDILAGILTGGGMLIHSFTGGLFVLFGVFCYLIKNNQYSKDGKKKRIFVFFGIMLITMIPYILLFKYNRYYSIFDTFLISETIYNINMNLSNFPSLLITINFDFSGKGIEYSNFGPPLYLFILIPMVFIKTNLKDKEGFTFTQRYNKFFPFIIGLACLSLFYFLNPIEINNISLRSVLDEQLYDSIRALWFFSISMVLLVTLSADKLMCIINNFIKNKKSFHFFNFGSNSFIYIILFIIIFSEIRMSAYYFPKIKESNVYTGFNSDIIDTEYTETILWCGINTQDYYKFIFPYETWMDSEDVYECFKKVSAFNTGAAYNKNINYISKFYELNSSEINYENLQELNFFDYDYIAFIDNIVVAKYDSLIENGNLIRVFISSLTGKYQVYKIEI